MSYQIFIGDCIDSMRDMPDQSVHSCITSPPYYGLRDYGVEGQIGLEQTPDEFIQKLVEVFREVRRVLRDEGTLWINIGDSWDRRKQLMGMPWHLAFALQEDGWILRQDIIWQKPNAMPESTRDRCTKAHEYIFLLTKRPKYYFDTMAIKEPANLTGKGNANTFRGGAYVNNSTFDNSEGGKRTVIGNTRARRNSFKRQDSKREQVIPGQNFGTHRPERDESAWDISTRNKRSVWTVATRGYKEAHFATFPPALIEPCILAGCPQGGVVLDPFGGSGTTAGVAIANNRKAILCELNPEYVDLVHARIESILSAYPVKKGNAA
ncbi:TPA: site-specific DNA-methyltransferase [Yersinia enterocolitica]